MVIMTRSKTQKSRGNELVTMHASKHAEQKPEVGDQLLPGILNEITIYQIALKLPWKTFYILSSVSRCWQRAIRSHQIYDARVGSKSSQTLVVLSDFNFEDANVSRIALFSVEDSSWYYLPPIPGRKGGNPCGSEWIWLDGKLYVLGGLQDSINKCTEMYVWDLAGQQRWKQCASMKEARVSFGCAVKDGQIYVFAGDTYSEVVRGSEVYDPKEDAWSPFTPVPLASLRTWHRAIVVGEELFLYGFPFLSHFDAKTVNVAKEFYDFDDKLPELLLINAIHAAGKSAEVYHPHKDRWRIVKEFITDWGDKVLMVRGKLHRIRYRMDQNPWVQGIEVYNIHANSWNSFHPISLGGSEFSHLRICEVFGAVCVDDEVYAAASWTTPIEGEDGEVVEDGEAEERRIVGTYLIRSQGVGGKNTEISWEILDCPITLDDHSAVMCPIQL